MFPESKKDISSDLYEHCNPAYLPISIIEEEYSKKMLLGETKCTTIGEYKNQLQDAWDEERRKEAEQKEEEERSKVRKAIPDTWALCTGVLSFNEYVYGATGVTFDGKE